MFDSNSLLVGPLGNQYGNQDFGNSNDFDWSTLQGPDRLQVQGNVPPDLWFDSIPGSLSAIQSTPGPTDDSSLLLPGPLPNSDTQEFYLLGAYSSSLLSQEVVPIGDINFPSFALLPGAIDPHIMPPLTSIPTPECPLQAPTPSI